MPWREPEIPDTTATKTTPPDRSLVAPLPVVLPLPPLAFAVSGVPASGSAPLLSHATVLGFLLGMVGAAVIALYVLVNHRSRARGGRAHWTAGWLLALPGMAAMGCGWGFLCLAEPRVRPPVEERRLAERGLAAVLEDLLEQPGEVLALRVARGEGVDGVLHRYRPDRREPPADPHAEIRGVRGQGVEEEEPAPGRPGVRGGRLTGL